MFLWTLELIRSFVAGLICCMLVFYFEDDWVKAKLAKKYQGKPSKVKNFLLNGFFLVKYPVLPISWWAWALLTVQVWHGLQFSQQAWLILVPICLPLALVKLAVKYLREQAT